MGRGSLSPRSSTNGPTSPTDWALQSSGKGYIGDIDFKNIETLDANGSGKDTLSGPIAGATWTIDGDGNGSLLSTKFSGFGLLQGSDHGNDTFVISPRGTALPGATPNQALSLRMFSGR